MGVVRLLVFNCHEAWVHMLSGLEAQLDIVIGLPGHHSTGWDERMRPVPRGARLVAPRQVLGDADGRAPFLAPSAPAPSLAPPAPAPSYDCIICHNLTDLLDCKDLTAPRLLVVHSTYEGRKASEGAAVPVDQLRGAIQTYLRLRGGHAVAVSRLKTRDGQWPRDVVTAGVDAAAYPAFRGNRTAGLRVVNQIALKREVLLWDFHEAAMDGLPVRLVGHNPEREGVAPADDWDHLKRLLREHRFYVHTADPRYEDGFNMATLEAMAAGLPVIGNRHPTSPVEHGVSGFLAETPDELRGYAERLLADRDLAARLGAAGRETVNRRFPVAKFHRDLTAAIQRARRNWRRTMRRAA